MICWSADTKSFWVIKEFETLYVLFYCLSCLLDCGLSLSTALLIWPPAWSLASGQVPMQVDKLFSDISLGFGSIGELIVNDRHVIQRDFAKQTKLLRLRSDFVSLLDASKQGHFLHPRGQANAVLKGEGIEVQKHATNIYYCRNLYILRDLEMRCVFWRMRIVLLGLGSFFHASLLRYAILVEPDS